MKPLRFTHLRLENWKNFAHVDVELEQRALLIGPNAAGKSNLLDALVFLRDLATPGCGLPGAVEQRGGYGQIHSFLTPLADPIRLAVTVGTDRSPARCGPAAATGP